jgi:DHA3 family tetracycline resistance protein-like MFS transporter
MVFSANMVYQVTRVGLNPLQLVLVGTTLEVTCFIFEVPTGIVADLYSRRLSVIIGTVLVGLGFILEGAVPRFEAILLAQVIWGIGATFTSGATEAWIADEVGEDRASATFLRGAQAGQVGSLVGIAAGAGLGSLQINLPIILGGALFVGLGVALVVMMPEANFRPTRAGQRNTFGHMADTLRGSLRLLRLRPVLLTIFGLSLVYGLHSEGFDRLWTAHVVLDFALPQAGRVPPVVWIGLIQAGAVVLGVAATELAKRRLARAGPLAPVRMLQLATGLLACGLIAFGLASDFVVALALLWLVMPARDVIDPVYMGWLNRKLDSDVRATAISMTSQMNALGQIGGGPVMGWIGTALSLRAAMVGVGVLLLPALGLGALALRQETREIGGEDRASLFEADVVET